MFLILSCLLSLTLFGATHMDRDNEKEEETEMEEVIEEVTVPGTFEGRITDEYGVPEDVMKVITDYMDRYYHALYTLEDPDFTGLFDNELMEAISDRAVSMVLDVRRNYDFDFRMNRAHYDLNVMDYERNGEEYTVFLMEDDYMNFVFLGDIESQCFDIENYFVIRKEGDNCKIHDLEKVQGYYLAYYEEADSVEDVDTIYDYYSSEFKDMAAYNEEVLKAKAQKEPYTSSLSYAKAYDRNKAVVYADTYYHNRNPLWYNFSDEGGNCQNYASQCMLEGGIAMDYYGDEQWKCYVSDPEYEPEINEEESSYGRTRSWVNVNYFYNYAKWNEGKGMVADTDVNLYYAEPGDIILVGNGGMSHTVIVSKVIDGHILVDSNSIDMKDYPVEAYTYTTVTLIKILGSN